MPGNMHPAPRPPRRSQKEPAISVASTIKGALAGAIGGALGTVVLNEFQTSYLKLTRQIESSAGSGATPLADQQRQLLNTFEKAHLTTAETAAQTVGTRISSAHRAAAATTTEFAFGMLSAAVYGALAESVPAVTAGYGTLFGAVLFTGASEAVLPALGWVPAPSRRTPVQHVGGLAGNVVYGITTEAVRRLLRSMQAS